MIFASWIYDYVVTLGSGDTRDVVLIDMNFRSLYQINPDHLIVLGYASIAAQRKDGPGANINEGAQLACRLIGKFNETYNVPASIVVPRNGDSIATFTGIAFSTQTPFLAPLDSRILMPPDFQVEFEPSSAGGAANSDSLRVMFTIGYEITLKGTRF